MFLFVITIQALQFQVANSAGDGIFVKAYLGTHGGDYIKKKCNPRILKNNIHHNKEYGIKIFSHYSNSYHGSNDNTSIASPLIKSNFVYNNGNSAIACTTHAKGSRAQWDPDYRIVTQTNPALQQNTFDGNNVSGIFCKKTREGVFWVETIIVETNPVITSNIITNNGAYGLNAIKSVIPDSVRNNNFWGNDSSNFKGIAGGLGILHRTNLNGDSCDFNLNIFFDPEFWNGLNNDFRLMSTSKCIDAGDLRLPRDEDGSRPDIGALSFIDSLYIYKFPQTGWYLISLPCYPSDNSLRALFPSAIGAFGYNANTGLYYETTKLEPKRGYWLLIPSPTTVMISGVPLTSFTEHYSAGWHFIGSVNKAINFTDPNDNPDGSVIGAYGWDIKTNQYFQVYPPGSGKLEPKEGYWLAVFQDCDLTIGGAALSKLKGATKVDKETFYKQFDSQPPAPPFLADQNIAELLPITEMTACNYPNPFNPETVIEYALPEAGLTRIIIYNALGQKIRSLLKKEQKSGIYQETWNGRDDNGSLAPSGIYFYRITHSGSVKTGKMLLLK